MRCVLGTSRVLGTGRLGAGGDGIGGDRFGLGLSAHVVREVGGHRVVDRAAVLDHTAVLDRAAVLDRTVGRRATGTLVFGDAGAQAVDLTGQPVQGQSTSEVL